MNRLVQVLVVLTLVSACQKLGLEGSGGLGGSEVGNGGDPEFVTAEHGLRYAYHVLERIEGKQVPAFIAAQYSVEEINWFLEKRLELASALKRAKLQWVDTLPTFCRDHAIACARAGDTRIYILRGAASRFRDHREAAGHMVHEAVHLCGESDETRANRAGVMAMAIWTNMGHPETPHWFSAREAPLAKERVQDDPYLLRWQYADTSGGKFYVWDERSVQIYDPIHDEWELKVVPENPFEWKRSKGTYAIYSHYSRWIGQQGVVYVACRSSYKNLDGYVGVRLNGDTLKWKGISNYAAPADRMYAGIAESEDRLIVWGGQSCSMTPEAFNDGGVYDPISDRWESIDSSSPSTPTPRYGHSLQWLDGKLVVWGGFTVYQNAGEIGVAKMVNDGAIYDPKSNEWETLPVSEFTPSPRLDAHLIWTGDELLVFGGREARNRPSVTTGALYNPKTRIWRPMALPPENHELGPFDTGFAFWTGSALGFFSSKNLSFYDVARDTWTDVGRTLVPNYEHDGKFAWTGFEGIFWSRRERKGLLLFP